MREGCRQDIDGKGVKDWLCETSKEFDELFTPCYDLNVVLGVHIHDMAKYEVLFPSQCSQLLPVQDLQCQTVTPSNASSEWS